MRHERLKFLGRIYKPKNEEETRFCSAFDAMFEGVVDEERRLVRDEVTLSRAVQRFFSAVEKSGEDGYVLGGKLLGEEIVHLSPGRSLFSRVLTLLARQYVPDDATRYYVDSDGVRRHMFPESTVHHVGRFISAMHPEESPRVCDALVHWCEDMHRGIDAAPTAAARMDRQETAVIRGAIFSTSVDQRRMQKFWLWVADAEHFPWRIFSDPCRSAGGTIFATTHTAAIAKVCTVAPEQVVRRIAEELLERAIYKREEVHLAERLPFEITVPATPEERRRVFRVIVNAIEHPRQEMVADLLRPVLGT